MRRAGSSACDVSPARQGILFVEMGATRFACTRISFGFERGDRGRLAQGLILLFCFAASRDGDAISFGLLLSYDLMRDDKYVGTYSI